MTALHVIRNFKLMFSYIYYILQVNLFLIFKSYKYFIITLLRYNIFYIYSKINISCVKTVAKYFYFQNL